MNDYLKIAKEVMRERQIGLRSEAVTPLEAVLRGPALELWSDAQGERFWLVADEEDAVPRAEPGNNTCMAAEARRVIQIGDPAIVREVHEWKRMFNMRGRE
jgi:hypothetical protein